MWTAKQLQGEIVTLRIRRRFIRLGKSSPDLYHCSANPSKKRFRLQAQRVAVSEELQQLKLTFT